MQIREMFVDNINRPINGVIQVDQDTNDIIEQEVREYVITRELKRHFITFFDYYGESFDHLTHDIGVWISGFFGSGKSHFLKMLSYILENKMVNGTPTVELFRRKFEDDPATFLMIDRAVKTKAETILFNIDVEGSINKDKTAVLRVFAKMFYSHLGFYGENLKVAMLEQYIDQLGKTEEFRRVFEEKKKKRWVDQRKAFAFNGKFIIPTLMEVLDMSEEDAKRWFQDKTAVEFSIAQLVEDIKAYVDTKPKDFRLLFMIDEVGQYVGTDTDMLLNLQSLVEKIGSACGGKVWVMCTGQEAIDDIIKVRSDEFSRIQARFKTRLSLSSSSVDEVIQKRILKKKPQVEAQLEELYQDKGSTLTNLFSFKDAKLDIQGFSGAVDFSVNFPFVPYQFLVMQQVFTEIRKHGVAGKHMSDGERSMLSGFQEAAQKVQEKDEYALVPFYRFYDTVHSFLESSIRRVIERCQNAALNSAGIEPQDVDVLKLLYLIRYVNDIPENVENIVILMADDIRTDKVILREQVKASLNRLYHQNYIGRTGDIYHFLTDEEQDIARDIKNTPVDTAAIVERISHLIFTDIYPNRKFRYGIYDFDFDKMVDGTISGSVSGGMKLRFLTAATDATEKTELQLMAESKGQAIVVLSDSPYFDSIQSYMKVRKYVKQRNVAQLPKSMQDIIRGHQDEANKFDASAKDELKKAIEKGAFYVDGERLDLKSGDAKARIDQVLEYLVTHVYSELNLIGINYSSDADILSILSNDQTSLAGITPNQNAAAKVEEFLIVQDRQRHPTSMFDIQSRYQSAPYGWKEIDIAAVVALLITQQKVTIKYGGATIQPGNPRLPDYLRKRSEIGKTSISARKHPPAQKIRAVREVLREYFDVMDVPNDEDRLVEFIVIRFEAQKTHFQSLNEKYNTGRLYPDRDKVQEAIRLTSDVLSQQKDNLALIDRVLKLEDDLFDSKEALQDVESFFRTQVQIFDSALELEQQLLDEREYLSKEPEIEAALNKIRLIVKVKGNFRYQSIPELNELMKTVRSGHERLLTDKRKEIGDLVTQCMGAVHAAADGNLRAKEVIAQADAYFARKRQQIKSMQSLILLDGLTPPMLQYKDNTVERIEVLIAPPPPVRKRTDEKKKPKPKNIRTYNRQIFFPAKTLTSNEEIDAYMKRATAYMKEILKSYDGIKLS